MNRASELARIRLLPGAQAPATIRPSIADAVDETLSSAMLVMSVLIPGSR